MDDLRPTPSTPARAPARGTAAPAALRRLLDRHSIGPRRMTAPGPSPAQWRLAALAALRAPDHGRLLPWRAVVVPERQRDALRELFAQVARDAGGTDDEVARERARAHHGPVLVAWIARIADGVDEVPPHEQWMCASGALANFLDALHLMGFGAKTLSGRKCAHPVLTRALCADGERLVAFVCAGTPTRKPSPRVVDDADEVLSTWGAARGCRRRSPSTDDGGAGHDRDGRRGGGAAARMHRRPHAGAADRRGGSASGATLAGPINRCPPAAASSAMSPWC